MQRLPGLDLLRAIAIVWVILFHAGTLGLGWPLGPVARFGWMGVDLFFVLSGFLIGAQWFAALDAGRASFGSFYARRAWRIFPAYLVALGLYLLVPQVRERAQMQPAWQFFTFTENLLIDFSSGKTFSHVWSLCVEEHFYVLFPLLSLMVARRATAGRTVALLALLMAAGMAWRAFVWFGDVGLRTDTQTQGYFERIYYPTWTRLDGLLCGVALAAIKTWRPRWWAALLARRGALLALGAALLALSVWLFGDEPGGASAVLGYPLLSVALACVVAAGAHPAIRELPGSAFVAAVSYSLYLTHKQALHVVKTMAGPALEANAVLAVVVYGAAVLALGAALHFAVERPFLELRDRRRSYLTVPT